MDKITFITGGARSGKSRFALKLARDCGGRTAFIATCKPLDREMKKRIAIHKRSRPRHWQTFEENLRLPALLNKIGPKFDTIVIDCLTLLVSDFMLKGGKEAAIENEANKIMQALKKIKSRSIIVSNEVGLGIVPKNKLAREFRDIAGRINQIAADKSDRVFFMVSGIPWRVK